MTMQTRPNQQEVVIVAPGAWIERINQHLPAEFSSGAAGPNIHPCSNVYEAAARVLKLLRQGRTVWAYVLVDYLPAPEMHFFRCFNGSERIKTIALTAARRLNKLNQALSLGADEALTLDALIDPTPSEPQTPPPQIQTTPTIPQTP
ncbi:MAG: hypothetical protein AMJ79_09760, partial [Phycisphaerae bacterium SM23_30]